MLWQTLSPAWQACVAEAWAAYGADTVPIGAVIVDGAGRLLVRARNHIYDALSADASSAAPLQGTPLAHAEMNALERLGRLPADPKTCTLLTSLEPCPMCLGAIRINALPRVEYAARDPVGGSACLADASAFMRRRPVALTGPGSAELEAVLVAWHMAFALKHHWWWPSLAGEIAAAADWAGAEPGDYGRGLRLGEALFRAETLDKFSAERRPAAEVVDELAALAA